MARVRWCAALAISGLALSALCQSAPAQTGDKFSPKTDPANVALILQYKPRQENVDYTKVSADEQKACTAKTIINEKSGQGCGYVLFDPQGRPLRRLFATNTKSIDTMSYFKDGVEVYRESGRDLISFPPNQYRWLNAGGTKFGIDKNEDGKIDAWQMISAEEAAQEAFQAVTTKDFARLRMLFISEEELRALRLPEAQAARIRDNLTKAQVKLQELMAKSPTLNAQASFISVDSAVPYCVPANPVVGPVQDLLRFPSRAIHYQAAGKTEWLHTGELILVGQAWRLTDVPSASDILDGGVSGGTPMNSISKADPEVDRLLKVLLELDKNQPAWPGGVGKFPAIVDYTNKRVELLEKIYKQTADVKEKEIWMRQILDNLCTGHQSNKGDNSLLNRLTAIKTQLVQSNSSLSAYAHYREMHARFAFPLAAGGDVKTMNEWTRELENFVKVYPKSDDTPEALWHLAMNSEFGGPDKQGEAKNYYGILARDFTDHPLAPKAVGAVKRLDLNGKTMQLEAPTLQQGTPFSLTKLTGKVVVVYYWSSSCNACVGDFARMKQLHAANAAKGFEIVSINLDETPAAATGFLNLNPLPGIHLFQATEQAKGLESPPAIQYGIVAVPTIFLIGKDGRVIDRSIQINDLEDAVKKAI